MYLFYNGKVVSALNEAPHHEHVWRKGWIPPCSVNQAQD